VVYGVAVVLMAGSEVVEVDLIATHFSFFPSSTTVGVVSDFSVSSSEVTLSSVSASTPVVVSDSEDDEEVTSTSVTVVVTGVITAAAGVGSVSLFAAAAASFFALARSFLSNFYKAISFC
jgi:hypothetical protein